jgi:hypothetical protein
MKLIDGESKLGRKLEQWFSPDTKEIERLREKNQRRNLLPSADEPVTKLEQKITEWFVASEQDERPFIIEERLGAHRHQVLVLTYFRAILFEAGWFGRLKDVSDKVWRQFVAVHLTEQSLFSSLELSFFPYHDSVAYHNPFKENSFMKKEDFIIWTLNRLDKHEARRAYAFLKDKEMYWQEKRRGEQIEHQRMLMGKPPGGAPPPKDNGTQGK